MTKRITPKNFPEKCFFCTLFDLERLMKKIVVIDDNRDLLKLVQRFLQKKGFRVSVFTDVTKAISDIRIRRPQLVITDVFLKNFDGLEFCNKLRSHPATRRIPILVFSGFSKLESTAIQEFGATDFLAKPFSLNDLLEKLYSIFSAEVIDRKDRAFSILTLIFKKVYQLKRKTIPVFAFIQTVGYFVKAIPTRRYLFRRLSV